MSIAINIPYAAAKVVQSGSGGPVLSNGRLTIKTLRVFENTCRRYFSHKGTAAEERVGKILYNFESAEIQTWVYTEEDQLAGLDFNAFIVELKKKFLPRTWEQTLVRDQVALQGESTFVAWVDRVIAANTELGGTASAYYIEPDKLHLHLIPRMRPALERAYHANNPKPNATATTGILDTIADFADWKEHVNILDIELTEKNEEWVDCLSKMVTKPRSAAPSRPSNT
jgi:hypothetical protein